MSERNPRTLLYLAKLYLEYVDKGKALLASNFDSEDLLRSYRRKDIPKSGTVDGQLSFNFHGGGCELTFHGEKDLVVDFDFGEEDKLSGFDFWKLKQFLHDSQFFEGQYLEADLEMELESALRAGVLTKSTGTPGLALYYFSDSGA